MEIAIDFDGTCVTHDYPKVGKNIGALNILEKLIENKHNLILYTMRSGKELDDAINWFKENNIKLYGIQFNPTQKDWTSSNKCYAQLYIDDAALGCPLSTDLTISNRPFVDWVRVESLLLNKGII